MLSLKIASILPDTAPHEGLVLGSLWAQHFVLVLLCVQFRWYLYTKDQRKPFDEWILQHWKETFVANGLAVYPFLYFFQGLAAISEHHQPTRATIAWIRVLLHVLGIPFAFLLWDLGWVYSRKFSKILLINFHHLGVFLALPFHITEDPVVAARTSRIFGWIWLVHIFPWLIATPLQLLIAKGANEEVVVSAFLRTKHLYSAMTVFLVHDYFCGEFQPGFGWNYQTVSLFTLWIGRFGYNQNFRRSKIFRRIEFPGSIMVVFSSLFFEGNIYRGAAATACIYASILLVKSAFQEDRPGKWDPGHPSIARVLNDFEREFLSNSNPTKESPVSQESLFLWKENQSTLEEKYPLARAIINNNLQNLEAIIVKGGDGNTSSIYQPMRELKNQTPGELAVSLGRIRCVLLLITKAGLDPWEGDHCEGNSIWKLSERFQIAPLLELRDRLEPFALDAYPPVSTSISDRAAKIILRF